MKAEADPCYHILVVEDDKAVLQVTTRILVHSGYQVDAAEDGAGGWEALQARKYDLLITDNNMPKLSGVELIKRVRSARLSLPVIMATAELPTEELDRHPWLQLSATVQKPFDSAELLNTVKKVLREPTVPASADRATV